MSFLYHTLCIGAAGGTGYAASSLFSTSASQSDINSAHTMIKVGISLFIVAGIWLSALNILVLTKWQGLFATKKVSLAPI